MKRFLIVALALCLVLGLAACAKPAPQDPTTTPTTAPTTPPVPTSFKNENCLEYGTKEGVPGFFKLLSEQMPDHVSGLNPTAEEDCYNITPPGTDAKTDLQVFMSHKTGWCYIVQDGKITRAIRGILNQVLCDLDKDGKKDLLLITTWGSGTTYPIVGIYSSATNEFAIVHWSQRTYPWEMLWVVPSGADVHFEGKTEADNEILFPVLCVEGVYKSGKLVEYVVTGIDGNVVYQDGTYKFVPYEK